MARRNEMKTGNGLCLAAMRIQVDRALRRSMLKRSAGEAGNMINIERRSARSTQETSCDGAHDPPRQLNRTMLYRGLPVAHAQTSILFRHCSRSAQANRAGMDRRQ